MGIVTGISLWLPLAYPRGFHLYAHVASTLIPRGFHGGRNSSSSKRTTTAESTAGPLPTALPVTTAPAIRPGYRDNTKMEARRTSTAPFEAIRGRLFGLAYRMLGSRSDAEDIVQEAYVRWHETDHERIESAEAWLVTTTSRLAIDRLRRLKTERDAYFGPWLPEPIVTPEPPDRRLDLADDLSMALPDAPRTSRPGRASGVSPARRLRRRLRRDCVGARAERGRVPAGRPPRARARPRRTQAVRGHRSCQVGAAAEVHGRDGRARRAGAARALRA